MPRLAAVLVAALIPGFATAQESCSFRIVEAKVEKDHVQWTECKTVPVQKRVAVEVEKNGMRFIEMKTVTVNENISVVVAYDLKTLKATDAAGKAIAADKLAGLLKETPTVVVTTEPITEKHRALFKDKTVFLELPPPGAVKV
jgi:3-oxoacyl-ACP reductase-like protein